LSIDFMDAAQVLQFKGAATLKVAFEGPNLLTLDDLSHLVRVGVRRLHILPTKAAAVASHPDSIPIFKILHTFSLDWYRKFQPMWSPNQSPSPSELFATLLAPLERAGVCMRSVPALLPFVPVQDRAPYYWGRDPDSDD
jgi:hypothetical protein